ncbi:hypothetical protein LTR84_010537 [Exophiala bonariae]|uniref:Tachykinin family protein n=1 Tax=Exophiala bonariae TaxID=1690606 RepID=A0AAV9MW08_9EURO|nr:hypothetical protein LTR84_010537 [Exophiala bonariae]
MPDPSEIDPPEPDSGEPQVKLRFITARPDLEPARRESRAAINAHASQASWARIRERLRQGTGPQTSQKKPVHNKEQRRARFPDDRASSESELRSSNGDGGKRPGAGFVDSEEELPFRTAGTAIFESARVSSLEFSDVDPFTTYPSRLAKEVAMPIVSEVNRFLQIILLPNPHRQEQSIKQQWIYRYMNDDVLFHMLCFSYLARASTTKHGLNPINQRAYGYCYSELVRGLNRRLNNLETRYSDEILFAVQTLAFHGRAVEDDTDKPQSPSQGPLNSMQLLDIYAGRLDAVDVHLKALSKIVSMKGGLSEIKFPGLAAMLSYGDLLLASRYLRKPVYPFIPLQISPQHVLDAVRRDVHPLGQLGTGFRALYDLLPSDVARPLFLTLHNLSTYSLAVDDYIMGRSQAQDLGALADQRNFVQHNLLSRSLGPDGDVHSPKEDAIVLQQACWAAAVIYSLIAVFPVPHRRAPFAKLAYQLKHSLVYTNNLLTSRWHDSSSLLLWMIFMGALASTANDEGGGEQEGCKEWYINVLERFVHRMQIASWGALKDQLLNFLWFPSTSDADGQQLWTEINTSNPFI